MVCISHHQWRFTNTSIPNNNNFSDTKRCSCTLFTRLSPGCSRKLVNGYTAGFHVTIWHFVDSFHIYFFSILVIFFYSNISFSNISISFARFWYCLVTHVNILLICIQGGPDCSWDGEIYNRKKNPLSQKTFLLENNNKFFRPQKVKNGWFESLFVVFKHSIIIRTGVSHCLDFMSNT